MGRFNDEVLENAIKAHGIGPLTALDEVTIEFLKELQEYRRLEEQGLLLKLHFGKHDVVYEVVEGGDGKRYVIPRKCRTSALLIALNEKVGKTVFLTRAEAEKALAEMEKDCTNCRNYWQNTDTENECNGQDKICHEFAEMEK